MILANGGLYSAAELPASALSASSIEWEAESLRATGFLPSVVGFEPSPLWAKLVGTAPEEVNERPQQGLRQEVGPFAKAHLFINQLPVRVDVVLGRHPSSVATTETPFVSIGEYQTEKLALLNIFRKWLDNSPPVTRLAFAPILIHRVSDRQTAYQMLQGMLPAIKIDSANSEELFWQINRPRRSSSLTGRKINRISKWTVVQFQLVNVAVDSKAAIAMPSTRPSMAIRVELDISTENSTEVIPGDDLITTFDELCALADEITIKGDVP